MLRVMARLGADTLLVGVLMFAAAGTLAWWRAWLLLAVLLTIRMTGAYAVYRINPALLRDRARLPVHRDQSWTDRLLVIAVLSTGFLGLPVVAALDAFRWHVMLPPAPFVAGIGLALFMLGWSLKSIALRANAFATAVVRIQRERAHTVVDSGVYRIVRHPFYAADPLLLVGLGLWLQSYLAASLAVVPVAFMIIRLCLEERFLQRELPGYHDYTLRVRHRLIPGVW